MLARVAGRSPLEYLSEQEKNVQADVVQQLMTNLPQSMPALITTFTRMITQ
jgi:hypothetical protein